MIEQTIILVFVIAIVLTAYRTDEGKSYVLPVVRKVEAALGQDATLLHEYLPVLGSPEYRKGAIKLLFGDNEDAISRVG